MSEHHDLVARLRHLDSESVSDALDASGHTGSVLDGIGPLWPCPRIAGRVVPVRLVEQVPGHVSLRHLGTSAVTASGPDDVIVVDNSARHDVAGWGGLLSRAAAYRRVAGVVVSGAVRDVEEAHSLQFPVYGSAYTARTARGRVVEVEAASLTLGSSEIRRADFVIADRSAVVHIPAELIAEVLSRAETIAAREQAMARAIDAGVPVVDVMGGAYESMLGEARPRS